VGLTACPDYVKKILDATGTRTGYACILHAVIFRVPRVLSAGRSQILEIPWECPKDSHFPNFNFEFHQIKESTA
jgi:hypothetical protein